MTQKWEQTFAICNADNLQRQLSWHGDKGWELVSVTTIAIQFYLFFKRPA